MGLHCSCRYCLLRPTSFAADPTRLGSFPLAAGASFGAKRRWERVGWVHTIAHSRRGMDKCAIVTKQSHQGSVFYQGWLTPLGIGLGSPRRGGDDAVSFYFYVSMQRRTLCCP